jgi:hypothetical protein
VDTRLESPRSLEVLAIGVAAAAVVGLATTGNQAAQAAQAAMDMFL